MFVMVCEKLLVPRIILSSIKHQVQRCRRRCMVVFYTNQSISLTDKLVAEPKFPRNCGRNFLDTIWKHCVLYFRNMISYKSLFCYCRAQSQPQLRLDLDSFILTFPPSTHLPRITLLKALN